MSRPFAATNWKTQAAGVMRGLMLKKDSRLETMIQAMWKLAACLVATCHLSNVSNAVVVSPLDWTIDGAGSGRVYDGIGATSGGGATSRLLIDYPTVERN